MSGFSADWLRLREPFDHAARSTAALTVDLPRWRTAGPVLQVLDLACGSGANLRELAPRLGGMQRWRVVDHDPALLAALPQALAHWAHQHGHQFTSSGGLLQIRSAGFSAEVHCEPLDLVHELHRLDLRTPQLVTASALLDLVSAAWLHAFTTQLQHSAAALLFALNVDGSHRWNPTDPDDAFVHEVFSQHQRRDKGFGPALGPQAVPTALAHWAAAGYQVQQARSDWILDGEAATALRTAMIEGTVTAALEQAPEARSRILRWQTRRQAGVHTSRLQVGHVDLLALR